MDGGRLVIAFLVGTLSVFFEIASQSYLPVILPTEDLTEGNARLHTGWGIAEVGGPGLHPIAAITVGQKGKDLTEMGELRDAGAVGVSDDGVCLMSSAVMRRAHRLRRPAEFQRVRAMRRSMRSVASIACWWRNIIPTGSSPRVFPKS